MRIFRQSAFYGTRDLVMVRVSADIARKGLNQIRILCFY